MPLLNIREVLVDFPYEPYDCQLDYMGKVIEALQGENDALLESPTGTGKTLCLLCAVLGWRRANLEEVKRKAKTRRPTFGDVTGGGAVIEAPQVISRIIYSSRTHGQLSQVVNELKKTSYRPETTIIGSRQQLCIHPRVSLEVGTKQNHSCRVLTASRGCHYYNNVDKSGGIVVSNPEDKDNKKSTSVVLDIEDLVKSGKSQEVCPYYHSKGKSKNAELIFMPYNYLVDPKIRATLNLNLKDAIIIFDEAHNLAKVCSMAASSDLSGREVAGCISDVQRCIDAIQQVSGGGIPNIGGLIPDESLDLPTLLRLKEMLLDFEEKVASIGFPRGSDHTVKQGKFILELFEAVGVTLKTKDVFMDILDKVVSMVMTMNEGSSHKKSTAIQNLVSLVNLVFPEYLAPESYLEHMELHRTIIRENDPNKNNFKNKSNSRNSSNFFSGGPVMMKRKERIVCYWCFDSGIAMRALKGLGVRSFLLTSGTLSPMDSVAYEMKLPFEVRLENPHVAQKHQVFLSVLPRGPGKVELKGTYRNRSSSQYQRDLGAALVNFCRIIPHGVLVFFPSYAALDSMITAWRAPGPRNRSVLDQVSTFKHVVIEPRNSSQFGEAMTDYREKVEDESKSGAVLMAVCRGKSSEGMDFSDRQARAVLIVGFPYPSSYDLRVVLKKRLLDQARSGGIMGRVSEGASQRMKMAKNAMSGDRWYLIQAAVAVNQAMGRTIRHKDDFGAIILCDPRYSRSDVRGSLSKWLRPYLQVSKNFGQCLRSVVQFFNNTKKLGLDEIAVKLKRAKALRSKSKKSRSTIGKSMRKRVDEETLRNDFKLLSRPRKKVSVTPPQPPKPAEVQHLGLFSALKEARTDSGIESKARTENIKLEDKDSFIPLESRTTSTGSISFSERLMQLQKKSSSSAIPKVRPETITQKLKQNQRLSSTSGSRQGLKRSRNIGRSSSSSGGPDKSKKPAKRKGSSASQLLRAMKVEFGEDYKRITNALGVIGKVRKRIKGKSETEERSAWEEFWTQMLPYLTPSENRIALAKSIAREFMSSYPIAEKALVHLLNHERDIDS